MDTGSFILYIKADDICKGIAEDVETKFDTSNYELYRSFPKGKNQKVTWLMKDQLGGDERSIRWIMKKFVGLTPKTYSYLIDDGSEDKTWKAQKVCHKKKT